MIDSKIQESNRKLKDVYSTDIFSGRPIFRLVYSESCFENRRGNFVDTDNSGQLIRRVDEVRECKKYPYLKDTWILEKLVWIGGENPELPDARGYEYECIWAFQNKKNEPLFPHYHIVEIIIDSLLHGQRKHETDWDETERLEKEKEEQEYFDLLQDEAPSDLAYSDTVFLDSTKKFEG